MGAAILGCLSRPRFLTQINAVGAHGRTLDPAAKSRVEPRERFAAGPPHRLTPDPTGSRYENVHSRRAPVQFARSVRRQLDEITGFTRWMRPIATIYRRRSFSL
jgi:hypothetical protein